MDIHNQKQNASYALGEKAMAASQKVVLVVDDNKINSSILCRILKSEGYVTLDAQNGREALEVLMNFKQNISLVLLDIIMPVMDGYELLLEMNKTGLITSIPVIVTTGNDDEGVEIRCLEGGASDFLRKPYNAELVRHRVKSLLRLWDNAALISKLETDRLTGVYSREFFYSHVEEKLKQNPNDVYYIVYTDVDDFKMINVRYGTAVGDELLAYLANVFVNFAGDEGVCGRIGSDTFAMLIKGRNELTQEQVGALLDKEFQDAPVKGIQLKCGIFPVTDRSVLTSDMCDRAKLAVTTIKGQYGVHYAIYDDRLVLRAIREHQLADCMEDALKEKQFVMYLQPKHCTENSAVAGAEALVRWIHPELGFISPGEFIPLFERNGFITKLDAYMLNQACNTLKKWKDSGIAMIPISVNVSRADFLLSNLPEKIVQCVDSYDIPHEMVHLEITESAYTNNPKQIIADISMLRDMGFLIEMDDFGSGYSSLNMLSELPIDILKLDMRFMENGNDRVKGSKRNILSFIISLSKWLQLPTVAEGVETQEEFEQLKSMGCNLIQGYFFAKPMAIDDFEAYLLKHPESCKSAKCAITDGKNSNAESDETEKPLVLVAEDIDCNRELIKHILQPYYRVRTVKNGVEVCNYLKQHCCEVSCILLDLLMPVMDGFQVLEYMREKDMNKDIPIVITTEAGSDSELRALHLGADSFVAKPFNSEILLHHVKKAVEEKEYRRGKKSFECKKCVVYEKAYHDELTRLLNRYGMKMALEHMSSDDEFAVFLLDVDNLKQINEASGSAMGDKAIVAVAQALRNITCDEDVLARAGGDEFIILLRGMNEKQMALDKGEQIRKALLEENIAGTQIKPLCSIGIALANNQISYDEFSERADKALYHAKQERKGGCCLWQENGFVFNDK